MEVSSRFEKALVSSEGLVFCSDMAPNKIIKFTYLNQMRGLCISFAIDNELHGPFFSLPPCNPGLFIRSIRPCFVDLKFYISQKGHIFAMDGLLFRGRKLVHMTECLRSYLTSTLDEVRMGDIPNTNV